MKRASESQDPAGPGSVSPSGSAPASTIASKPSFRTLRALGVQDLRTRVCWADWYTSEGDGWYAWLFPRLAKDVNILPCFLYTPPSLGVVPKFSSPPQTPKAYADFIDVMITRFGEFFDWVELWNEPNNLNEWDSRMDPAVEHLQRDDRRRGILGAQRGARRPCCPACGRRISTGST